MSGARLGMGIHRAGRTLGRCMQALVLAGIVLGVLVLAGCVPVIPVPAPNPVGEPCECDCTVDKVVIEIPVPEHIWREALDSSRERLDLGPLNGIEEEMWVK